jgi:prenyltransferase beta subunit
MKRSAVSALAILVGLLVHGADAANQREQTVAYVRGLQGPDGGFYGVRSRSIAPGPGGTSLRATLAALRALKYFGGEVRKRDGCIRFVERCRDAASGGFAQRPGGKPDSLSTALGVMAVVELKQPTEAVGEAGLKYLGDHAKGFEEIRMAAAAAESLGQRPRQAGEWIAQVGRMANDDGSFGKGDGAARDTGSAVVTILRLGGTIQRRATVLRTLRAGQRADGGFGKAGEGVSDLETCYRVMRAFAMLKEKPADGAALERFVGRCRNSDGGYGVKPGEPSNVGATYNASIVLHWLGGS